MVHASYVCGCCNCAATVLQLCCKDAAKLLHSRAYLLMRAEDIDIDIEKEKKEKVRVFG